MSQSSEELRKFQRPTEIARQALIAELRRLLAECTEPQQERFGRLFPKGIDAMDDWILGSAITLCQRTIAKNSGEL